MKRISFFILAIIVFVTANFAPVAAAEPIKVFVDGTELTFGIQPFMKDNSILIALRDIAEAMGFNVTWIDEIKKIDIKGINGKAVELTIGENDAYVDGQKVEMTIPALIKNGTTFVPLRFVSEALGGKVEWTGTNNTVNIESGSLQASLGEYRFVLDKATGQMFSFINGTNPKKITELDSPIEGQVFFSAEKTPEGNALLTIKDNYGEPHIYTDIQSIYINLTNNTMHKLNASYKYRSEDNIKYHNNQVILTDGKTVLLIEDKTGEVKQVLDLVQLAGEDDSYFVEGMGDNFIIVRPNTSGLLTLINLGNHERVQLYKVLLDKQEQEYAETNDVPFKGDRLKFVEQKGNLLYFRNDSPLKGKDTESYLYELKN